MTRDQAVAQILIWAAILGTPALIALALAWARARDVMAACQCDTGRTPTPAEIADAIAIRDAEESWVLLVCAECGGVDCTHGAAALEESARQAESDWTEWEREVAR